MINYEEELKKCWLSTKIDGEKKGAALALEPSPEFYSREDEQESKQRKLSFFLQYLTPYKKQLDRKSTRLNSSHSP